MPAAANKAQAVGAYGVMPDVNTGELETTVLSVGGKSWGGALVALLHAITWLIALIVIFAWSIPALDNVANATESAKMLGFLYGFIIVGILVAVLAHASFVDRKDNGIASIFASVVLLALVGFENCLGGAYLAYSISVGDSNFYAAAMISELLVCTGSSMIIAFYINWSHRGNVDKWWA